MGLIKFSEAAHWYGQDGSAQYDADLRVARKELLYPSVTTIDKAWFANTFLEMWKMDQLVLACVNNPRQPHESPEEYAQRLYELSNSKARVAADFGTLVHKMVDEYPNSSETVVSHNTELIPYYSEFDSWYKQEILATIASEGTVLDHVIGVAGRFDRLVEYRNLGTAMVDFKTQGVKVDKKGIKKPVFYESWVRQLGFYSYAAQRSDMCQELPMCVSVIIDSTAPSQPYTKIWTREEQLSGYEDFVYAAYGWFKRKKFWPTKTQWKPPMVLTYEDLRV